MIDLNKICEMHGFKKTELAKRLWPNNDKPYHSYWYHQKHRTPLNDLQLVILGEITGMSRVELMEINWKSSQPEESILTFKRKGLKIQLCLNDHTTRITDLQSKVHEVVLSNQTTTLSDYIGKIDPLIETIEKSYKLKNN